MEQDALMLSHQLPASLGNLKEAVGVLLAPSRAQERAGNRDLKSGPWCSSSSLAWDT